LNGVLVMQRATDREVRAIQRVAEAVMEFLIAWDEGRRSRTPEPTPPQYEVKRPEPIPVSPPKPEAAKDAKPTVAEPDQLIDVKQVAELLGCSASMVYRLADSGRLPRSRRLGRLVRWQVGEIRKWVEDGCPKQYRR
jgi:excisionase family DNA binding protein